MAKKIEQVNDVVLMHLLVILLQNYVYFGDKDEPVIYIYDKSSMKNISSYRLKESGGITDMAMYASDVHPPATSKSVILQCCLIN